MPKNASLVRIIDVTFPGMLVDGDFLDSHEEVPFAVVLNNTMLKTASETEYRKRVEAKLEIELQ